MALLAGVLAVLVALVALTGAVIRAARAMFDAGSAARALQTSVESNTTSTDKLAARFDEHVSEVTARLTDYGDRIMTLERKWWK